MCILPWAHVSWDCTNAADAINAADTVSHIWCIIMIVISVSVADLCHCETGVESAAYNLTCSGQWLLKPVVCGCWICLVWCNWWNTMNLLSLYIQIYLFSLFGRTKMPPGLYPTYLAITPLCLLSATPRVWMLQALLTHWLQFYIIVPYMLGHSVIQSSFSLHLEFD